MDIDKAQKLLIAFKTEMGAVLKDWQKSILQDMNQNITDKLNSGAAADLTWVHSTQIHKYKINRSLDYPLDNSPVFSW